MNRAEILKILADNREAFETRFSVSSLSIFGSVARDQASTGSDVDILVKFNETPGLFKFLELKAHLENLCQCPVDLVTYNALKKQLREGILREAIDAI